MASYLVTFNLQVHIISITRTLHHFHHLQKLCTIHVQQDLQGIRSIGRSRWDVQLCMHWVCVQRETSQLLIHTARCRRRLLPYGCTHSTKTFIVTLCGQWFKHNRILHTLLDIRNSLQINCCFSQTYVSNEQFSSVKTVWWLQKTKNSKMTSADGAQRRSSNISCSTDTHLVVMYWEESGCAAGPTHLS